MVVYKLYLFTRKKKEKSVITSHYNKFLNLLMRKGLKNIQLNFFYSLLRNHKKRLKDLCFNKFNTYSFNKIVNRPRFPTFNKLLKVVFQLITLKLELKHKTFRRKELLVPLPVSPWRGLRLGLNLLLTNSSNILVPKTVSRKNKKNYQILSEFWNTFRSKSTTCLSINEFTLKVLDNSENFKLTQLFPVKKIRRNIFSEVKKFKQKDSIMYFRKKFLFFLGDKKLKVDVKRYKQKKRRFKKKRNSYINIKDLHKKKLKFKLDLIYNLKKKDFFRNTQNKLVKFNSSKFKSHKRLGINKLNFSKYFLLGRFIKCKRKVRINSRFKLHKTGFLKRYIYLRKFFKKKSFFFKKFKKKKRVKNLIPISVGSLKKVFINKSLKFKKLTQCNNFFKNTLVYKKWFFKKKNFYISGKVKRL